MDLAISATGLPEVVVFRGSQHPLLLVTWSQDKGNPKLYIINNYSEAQCYADFKYINIDRDLSLNYYYNYYYQTSRAPPVFT